MSERRLLEMAKRDLCKTKETYTNQKRPININPTHIYVVREDERETPLVNQKRPTKETYALTKETHITDL